MHYRLHNQNNKDNNPAVFYDPSKLPTSHKNLKTKIVRVVYLPIPAKVITLK